MTVFNRTLNLGGSSISQNLATGDSINVTVTGFPGFGTNGSIGTATETSNPVAIPGQDSNGSLGISTSSNTFVINTSGSNIGSYSVGVIAGKVGQSNFRSKNITGTVSGPPPDTSPAQFTFADIANAAPNSTHHRGVLITGGGMNSPATVTGGGGLFLVKSGSSNPSITSSDYTTANKTVSSGQYVWAKATASPNNGTSVNVPINVGGVTDTFTVSTPGGTSGGGSTAVQPGTPGNNSYGIAVFGPNASTEVFSSNLRASNLAVFSTFSLTAGASATFLCAAANNTSKVLVIATAAYQGYQPNISITKATDRYVLTNTLSSGTITGFTYAIRTS